MKLGQTVCFKKYIKKQSWDADKDITKEFFELYNIKYREDNTTYKCGIYGMFCPWWGHKSNDELYGVVCGKRTIFTKVNTLEGYAETENPIQIYLIAVNMKGFYRVPAEWIDEW